MVDILLGSLTIVGLSLFEIVSSIDNAVINADVLSTMSGWARRWFLIWGILIAVFLIRGGLPFLVIYSLDPRLGFAGTIIAAFSDDPLLARAIEGASPPLLMGGGVFLVFLFFHWLFLEEKSYGLAGEAYIEHKGVWFYAVVSVILTFVVWLSIQVNPILAFGAVTGSTVFFITHGFRQNAEQRERDLITGEKRISDWSKILYLEAIDASFSIDGVLGAFAFTFSVPLILAGNGIGAIVVRQLTVRNVHAIKRYRYLKNGAMYSIAFLGSVMLSRSFGFHLPEWLSPAATVLILAYFFEKSRRELNSAPSADKDPTAPEYGASDRKRHSAIAVRQSTQGRISRV